MKTWYKRYSAAAAGLILMCMAALPVSAQDSRRQEEQWKISETDLTLQYDDRYSLSELCEGWTVVRVETKQITSCRVSEGKNTGVKDTDVVLYEEAPDPVITAAGVGTADILLVPEPQEERAFSALAGELPEKEDQDAIEALRIHVTVVPARLTLMFVAGQSNAEGLCSANTGCRPQDSVACLPGTVYSTYVQSGDNSSTTYITDVSFSSYCTGNNAPDYVAGSLRGTLSVSGKSLEYPLDTLTEDGGGKTGPDSGLAYEWNRLTKDKVWVVNTAWSGSGISTWVPDGSNYKRTKGICDLARQTFEAEISAGHYSRGNTLLFWLQGEKDKGWTAKKYRSSFESVYRAMANDFSLDEFGMIMVRSSTGSYKNAEDIVMNGPRIAQYTAGNSKELEKAFVVSNVNEQWVSDDGVKRYFADAYPKGSLSYPVHGGTRILPVSVSEVHNGIHYSQIGHNENGITAALGMYNVVYGPEKVKNTSVSWRNGEGDTIDKLTVDKDGTAVLVPVVTPLYDSKKVDYSVEGQAVDYDEATGTVTWKNPGFATIYARGADGKTLSKVTVTGMNGADMRWLAGNHTGLFEYDGTLWYLKDGYIQEDYEGIVKYENGWRYVRDGKADLLYNGFAENASGWWYIENGKVAFAKNDIIKGTVNGENAWWYVRRGKVTFTDTVAKNGNGWWRIRDGKVDFTCNTVEKNENGWWYIQNGKVNFRFTGIGQNANGYWYCKKGKVDFKYNGTVTYGKKQWKVVNGKAAELRKGV